MRAIKSLVIIGAMALITSCGTSVKFPVSSTVPAADITAKKKQDKNKNYVVKVTAKNLAKASRLNPPKKTIVFGSLTKMARQKM